jgi:hypothetical protein
METTPHAPRPGWEHRLHAVLALLGREAMPQVGLGVAKGNFLAK